MTDTPTPMQCPMCDSSNVECDPKPHMHVCLACGYDGTTRESDLGARLRLQANISARPGQLDALNQIATEADRLAAENEKLQAIVDEWRAFCAALDETEDGTDKPTPDLRNKWRATGGNGTASIVSRIGGPSFAIMQRGKPAIGLAETVAAALNECPWLSVPDDQPISDSESTP